jgi:peptidoglycan/LPS O-acetylase OafA/YrhL
MASRAAAAAKSAEFKPEIQGLRAVGALLVATFHIWIGKVSGGVDVFFVVSGYLILGSLIRQAERTGRIDLIAFAYRLSKRLLPAALFVVLAIVVASWLWLPQTRWDFVAKEAIASTLYLENWKLIRQAVDYLARDELPSPFQHYWAIAIQGQFYVIFGVGLALYLYLALKARGHWASLVPALAAIFAGSLAYSVWLTSVDQPTAYFSTFTRLWEFALGGLLVVILQKLALGRSLRIALGWIGFAAVLSCGAVLQVSTVFPGYAALWPTLGACCIIAAGRPGSALGADTILASRPMAYLGDLSYSLYLWHWPVLIFYRAIFNETEAGLVAGFVILALSILLSAITQRFVEQPFIRLDRTTANPWPWLATAAAGGMATLLVAGTWYGYVVKVRSDELAAPLDLKTHPGALAFPATATANSEPLRPSPLAARDDKASAYERGCHQSLGGNTLLTCVFGDRDAETSIVIVGGSHSLMWLPAFEEFAARRKLKIVTMTKSSCPFSSSYVGGFAEFKEQCALWNEQVLAKLQEMRPDAVFTIATRGFGPKEVIPQGYIDQWYKLAHSGIAVLAIRDTPWMDFDVAECVEVWGASAQACTRARKEMLAETNPIELSPDVMPSNVHYIDLTRYFCTESVCPPVAGNVLIYSDLNHISATYARTLSAMLETAVMEALEQALRSAKAMPQPGETLSSH